VALVLVGVVAQAVIDVQGADRLGAGGANGEVEHADRVAAAGEHRHDRGRKREQALGKHPLQHLVGVHGLSLGARAQPAARTTKSSVGVGKPLRLTWPIGSRPSPSLPSTASATRSVTSTSPARARLTTRWARLT